MARTISYAQRYEDLHLMRCFGEQANGFYIDIGAGHPVYDNVSFAFYLRGWRGITVEPNPALAPLIRAVRPRDDFHQALVGGRIGEATFYVVDEFHGLSTMIERHARNADVHFGKKSKEILLPMTTLAALCAQHASAAIDFLKVDVEGAEEDVLAGGDWQRFRPKVVIIEALAPYTLAPAWEAWEQTLVSHGYLYAWFDSLNRYYVAEEAWECAAPLQQAPASFENVVQFGRFRPALNDPGHPDHGLAALIGRAAMARLPLFEPDLMLWLLTAEMTEAQLDRPVAESDIGMAYERLFGATPPVGWDDGLTLRADATVRDLYMSIIGTDLFRAAAGRISASYAW